MNTANSNGNDDEINLNTNNQANCVYPLTTVDNITDGPNGLPSVTSNITINGNPSTLRRQEGSDSFRIVHVASNGTLALKQLSIENGSVDREGGGIFNNGKLTLENSTVSKNTAKWNARN